jgi:hypothetical protein
MNKKEYLKSYLCMYEIFNCRYLSHIKNSKHSHEFI